ncbi:MAG TPA: NAD-dependent epimerase/dehydratase family protein [Myxococcota bacterium]|jgi:UDP-glucose 4-epimerase|nr:NAD-dependent epimerase/dehydratase family protein [Myxococcota bacterium]
MKALITGGAGFIGGHLTERLLRDGHEVWVLDDLSTGAMANIDPFLAEPRFHYKIGSVLDEMLVGEYVDRADVVFHLAAAVGVKLIVERPAHTIETNVRGTEVVLSRAAKKGKLVVVASTSEVYGKGVKIPYAEDDDLLLGATTKSRWGYGCSKAIDEFLALAYAREYRLPVIITRFFNTVGPRQTGRYGMVVPSFVRQGLRGEDITVYGTGEQRRCFGDVADVVECLVRLVAEPRAVGQVFNVGTDHEISINDLAALVRERTGGRSRIVHVSYEEAYAEGFEDLQRRVPDLTKLERTIGYRPRTPIDTIVERVVADVRRRGD